MKNEVNTKITVQEWLQFLQSEKDFIYRNEANMTPRFIGVGTLLIGSIVSYFQGYPYFLVLSGIILSFILFGSFLWTHKCLSRGVLAINKLQVKILGGTLHEIKDIVTEYEKIKY